MRNSVTLSTPRYLVYRLISEGAPLGWQESAYLRHHRLIEVDDQGIGINHPIRIDPELGIIVDRSNSN